MIANMKDLLWMALFYIAAPNKTRKKIENSFISRIVDNINFPEY